MNNKVGPSRADHTVEPGAVPSNKAGVSFCQCGHAWDDHARRAGSTACLIGTCRCAGFRQSQFANEGDR